MRASRKNMFQASANTSNYQAAMVGSKILGNLGSYGLNKGGFGKDGATTERSGYQTKDNVLTTSYADKSFVSSSGMGGLTHGAVSGLSMGVGANLESSLMKNILSTPSSNRSEE
jgi:hypothetical protein